MARSGLTKAQVRSVRDRMVADGKYPSVDAVRHALGDSGSKSTIHKYLRELREEDPDVGAQRGDTEDALRAVVAQLAERLHADADARIKARIEALQAAHDAELCEKDAELAALRASVAALSARLEQVEQQGRADAAPWDWHVQRFPVREMRAASGFGRFDSALLSSRSGQHDSSPFGMIRTVARS